MPILTRRDLTRLHLLQALGGFTLLALLLRLAWFDVSPGSRLFHPHGYCYLWQPDLVAAHVLSDGLIGVSYFTISITLIYLVRRARHELPFMWIFVAFGAFIIACGSTHLMEVWTLWVPSYWLSADLKIITAVASVATAVMLPPLVPKVLTLVAEARLSETRRVALERTHAELESRVEERTEALRAALHQAEEANRARDMFLATVSHELRTPLNAIVGWSRMLLATGEDAALVARGVEVIERNARLQTQLVEELLDVSRMTSGTLRLDRQPADLAVVVSEAIQTVVPAAQAKGIELRATLAPAAVWGDARRLQQVAWNLLANAVKFSPPHRPIEVIVGVEEGLAVMRVRDFGVGLDPAFRPRLFEPFSQHEPVPVSGRQGLGLGLAIARHLVELHGGTIDAASEGPDRGATFTVAIPRYDGFGTVRPAHALEAPPRLDGLRILVVDDDDDGREALAVGLEYAGATVVTAPSADRAWALLGKQSFDVLISDLAMPGRDGLAFVRDLRASDDARLRALPAVAVTARAGVDDRVAAMAAGFQRIVTKPVEFEGVQRVVAEVIGRSV